MTKRKRCLVQAVVGRTDTSNDFLFNHMCNCDTTKSYCHTQIHNNTETLTISNACQRWRQYLSSVRRLSKIKPMVTFSEVALPCILSLPRRCILRALASQNYKGRATTYVGQGSRLFSDKPQLFWCCIRKPRLFWDSIVCNGLRISSCKREIMMSFCAL